MHVYIHYSKECYIIMVCTWLELLWLCTSAYSDHNPSLLQEVVSVIVCEVSED